MNIKRFRIITDMDMRRLSTVIEDDDVELAIAISLDEIMSRSAIVDATKAPRDLVTMNTQVRGHVEDERVGEWPIVKTITLVYPRAADISNGRIAVTTPLGASLLGARAGEDVWWAGKDGQSRKMRIAEIIYQPEAAGDWHL